VGKVPAIETESGDCIYESLIIADYLDETYPQRQLQPRGPMQKAKDRILVEHFSKVGIFIIIIIVAAVVSVNTLLKITCPSSVTRTPLHLYRLLL
jgi:hypothetical protein